jgi:hypothetical protein
MEKERANGMRFSRRFARCARLAAAEAQVRRFADTFATPPADEAGRTLCLEVFRENFRFSCLDFL